MLQSFRQNDFALTIEQFTFGHALPKIWRTYDRHDYLEEQAKAYFAWVTKLEAIWKGRI